MNRSVTVLKVYPKINSQFIASYNDLGFQLSTSKNKGISFTSNENKTVEDLMSRVNKFLQFADEFGLKVSFDLSKVVTTSVRFEELSINELKNNLIDEVQ